MYVVKCPLRLSLVGGSTDLQSFIDKYKIGRVISFPCNLYVYVSLHENNRKKLILNYSETEEINNIQEIKNELAKQVLIHFFNDYVPPITLTFNSDIYSVGSGLAASTAYILSLIKILSLYTNKHMSNIDICNLAIELERKSNPLTGYQDSYGCGISNFKKIEFAHNSIPKFTYYNSYFIDNFDISLLYTGENRNSTEILKTINVDKSYCLLQKVDELHDSIENNNINGFFKMINESWEIKKQTSSNIMTKKLLKIENDISKLKNNNMAFKLCGAGAGGYFLLFVLKNDKKLLECLKEKYNIINVQVDNEGIKGIKL